MRGPPRQDVVLPSGLVVCARCKKEKPLADMKRRSDRPRARSVCSDCHREYMREYTAARLTADPVGWRKAAAERVKAWRHEHQDVHRQHDAEEHRKRRKAYPEQEHAARISRVYGLTRGAYAAMLEGQGGGCAICGTTHPGNKRRHFAVDHDHDTGKVRGLLCMGCNRALGMMSDDAALLRKAAEYIEAAKPDLGPASSTPGMADIIQLRKDG